MADHEKFMQRCIGLGAQALGKAAPNPLVGCVIVHNGIVIGEGYHENYGEAHAEANAIASVHHKNLLKESTLYVNLEPCSHFGKTPPCSDLIIENKIPYVVTGCVDSNPLVKGKGIEKLVKAGIDVKTGVLEKECRELNRRFFTWHEKKRPYIILKWAQTQDGFIGKIENDRSQTTSYFTSEESLKLVHRMRSEEQAIMAGTNTILLDNPMLTVRRVPGRNPLRITFDRHLKIPPHFHILDKTVPTLIFTAEDKPSEPNLEYARVDFNQDLLAAVLAELHKREIQSVIVEGGEKLLNSFIEKVLWDEVRVFTADKKFLAGVNAPKVTGQVVSEFKIENDKITICRNPKNIS